MTNPAELERRIAELECNQRRIMVLMRPGSQDSKAFVRAVMAANLGAQQEKDALNVIRSFVVPDKRRESTISKITTPEVRAAAEQAPRSLTGLMDTLSLVVPDTWVAESLVVAVRKQEPQRPAWGHLDHENVMAEWPEV